MANEDLLKLKIDKSKVVFRPRKRKKVIYAALVVISIILLASLSAKGVFTPSIQVPVATITQFHPSQAFTMLNASGYVVAQRKSDGLQRGDVLLGHRGHPLPVEVDDLLSIACHWFPPLSLDIECYPRRTPASHPGGVTRHSATRTTSFPVFSPRNSMPRLSGARSNPSITCRRCCSRPALSCAASQLRASW